MTARTLLRSLFLATAALLGQTAFAIDLRLDVATDNNNGNDTDWFGSSQLVNLNFRSVNGHDIEQGGATHQSTIQAAGNTLGVYYDSFHTLYSPTETPAAAAATIQSWIHGMFGSNETSAWLVLNEVDGSTWSTYGDAYRTWLVNTMSALNADGYQHIVLYAPQSLASKTYASTWQGITQYAYIGAEMYIDGQTVVNDNFSVPTLQSTYQSWYNAWTSTSNGAGLSASKLLCGEHFSVNTYDPSHYWGANGVSGTQWQAAIEARDIAIHSIPFGGFIGYAWDKDAQATGNPTIDLAAQISYERAYASTLVTQTEIPAWTGNDGTGSWADYLNWTGGLPSTTSSPFPLLAASNPALPKQTTANFFNASANTVITLDGLQSITHLAFSGPFSYTITPGTGGSLTLTGSGASVSVTSGSHKISSAVVLASDLAANLTGNLVVSGSISGGGGLTKTGSGTLILSNANTLAGGTLIGGGTLALANSLALQQSKLDTSGSGYLSFGPLTAATFGGLSGPGSLKLANSASSPVALSVGNNNVGTTYSGTLSGPGSLTKVGRGTLTLTGSDTYTGGTIVAAGALIATSPMAIYDGTALTVGSTAAFIHAPFAPTAAPNVVPEPSALALLGIGVGLLVCAWRRGLP